LWGLVQVEIEMLVQNHNFELLNIFLKKIPGLCRISSAVIIFLTVMVFYDNKLID